MQALKLIFFIMPFIVNGEEITDVKAEPRGSQGADLFQRGGVAFQMTSWAKTEQGQYVQFERVELAEPMDTIVNSHEGWFQAPTDGFYYLEIYSTPLNPDEYSGDPGSSYNTLQVWRKTTNEEAAPDTYEISSGINYLCAWDKVFAYRTEGIVPETTTMDPSENGPYGRWIEMTFSGFLLYPMSKSSACSGY